MVVDVRRARRESLSLPEPRGSVAQSGRGGGSLRAEPPPRSDLLAGRAAADRTDSGGRARGQQQ